MCGKGFKGCGGCMQEEKRAYFESGECWDNESCTLRAWDSCTYNVLLGGSSLFTPCGGKDISDYFDDGWPVDRFFPPMYPPGTLPDILEELEDWLSF
jgi:hypothetical protein